METQGAYTSPMRPEVSRTRKVVKSHTPIPEGYVSAEEFNRVFEQKIHTNKQVETTPKERLHTVEEFIDKLERAVLERLWRSAKQLRTHNKQLNIIFHIEGNIAIVDKILASKMITK